MANSASLFPLQWSHWSTVNCGVRFWWMGLIWLALTIPFDFINNSSRAAQWISTFPQCKVEKQTIMILNSVKWPYINNDALVAVHTQTISIYTDNDDLLSQKHKRRENQPGNVSGVVFQHQQGCMGPNISILAFPAFSCCCMSTWVCIMISKGKQIADSRIIIWHAQLWPCSACNPSRRVITESKTASKQHRS